jgi:hypothetical protein
MFIAQTKLTRAACSGRPALRRDPSVEVIRQRVHESRSYSLEQLPRDRRVQGGLTAFTIKDEDAHRPDLGSIETLLREEYLKDSDTDAPACEPELLTEALPRKLLAEPLSLSWRG